jgi:pyruvate/2-oxoglutarate dehydrogenase complex dihydrolipoamide dehydrogenase (E3) component
VRAGDDVASIDATHLLVTAGRTANLEGLNLEAARIRRSKSDPGALALNPSLRTSNAKIFAVGEAASHAPSPHLAELEADLVVRAALLGEQPRYEPAAIPRLTLTDPPIAEIGLTEPMARIRFKSGFSVLRASYGENDFARAGRQAKGVVKLIVAGSGKLLGAGIVGPGAAELATLVALAIQHDIPARALADLTAPYPSYGDLLRRLGEQAMVGAAPNRRQARRFALNRLLP